MYYSNFLCRAAALALVVSLVTACGGGGGGPSPAQTSLPSTPTLNMPPIPPAQSNALKVTVDNGPADTGYNVNRLYTDVTICYPGSTTQCQTIDHVVVDTGSMGLRLLASAMAPALNLKRQPASSGLTLVNCAQFVDGTFAWGPVAMADVLLAGKTATSVPIQIIADPAFSNPSATSTASKACPGATPITAAKDIGAKGILGLGLFKEDCGSRCAGIINNGIYFTCKDATCVDPTPVTVDAANQVQNPVPWFAADNNGMLIELPVVDSVGAVTVSGSLIFGIGTQSNNSFTPGAVLRTNVLGNITTQLGGQSMSASFIDTGSNGLYFDSATIPKCTGSIAGFYCPTALSNLSATMLGTNGVSVAVPFSVGNASAMFAGASNTVLPTLAGPIGSSSTFDWGLPFFYGRRVFIGIEGQRSTLGTGPFYAF